MWWRKKCPTEDRIWVEGVPCMFIWNMPPEERVMLSVRAFLDTCYVSDVSSYLEPIIVFSNLEYAWYIEGRFWTMDLEPPYMSFITERLPQTDQIEADLKKIKEKTYLSSWHPLCEEQTTGFQLDSYLKDVGEITEQEKTNIIAQPMVACNNSKYQLTLVIRYSSHTRHNSWQFKAYSSMWTMDFAWFKDWAVRHLKSEGFDVST